jgi:hypothetical protein
VHVLVAREQGKQREREERDLLDGSAPNREETT